jgi:McrBC 5-methylcytosine restriction system component
MIRIPAREGDPLEVDPDIAQLARRRLIALEQELRPRISFLADSSGLLVIQNLVGSVQISANLVIDIEPKTLPAQDWAGSLLDLMRDERAHFGGKTQHAELISRRVLPDAFARIYADQLWSAVRSDGPLLLLRRRDVSKARLAGRLDVSRWVTRRITRPESFPQQETVLSADNEFTVAMAWVAEALAIRCRDPQVHSLLRSAARALRPGFPEYTHVDPGVAFKAIPPQWRAYGPAWETAKAILRRLSPLHRSGLLEGLNLAIEPWPLLETLLHRALQATAAQGQAAGIDMHASGHSTHRLLVPIAADSSMPLSRVHTSRSVEPDGSLQIGGQIVATFEAKYSVPTKNSIRSNLFQAMSTAAAVGSQLAILIYPERSSPIVWETVGFHGRPRTVVAIGLDMYGYRYGLGDTERGEALFALVQAHTGAITTSAQAEG